MKVKNFFRRLKNINQKYYAIFFACFISIGFGLSDYDYFWQCLLGKYYLNGEGFYASRFLSWGTLGKEPYLDHEWLSNIILYLFNSIGDYGALIMKLVLCTLVGITTVVYVKKFNASKYGYKFYVLILDICLVAGLLYKIKPYMFSIVFLMLEILMLYEYEEKKNLKESIIKSTVLVLLWNNMHSGSVPLYFAIAGLFWLTHLRERKSIFLGIYNVALLGINPYGFKLILFDLAHNSEKIMKLYNKDWQPLDTKNVQSIVLSIVVLSIIYLCCTHKIKRDLFAIIGLIAILFMGFGSLRHLMYILPFIIIILHNMEIERVENVFTTRVITLIIISFFLLNITSVLVKGNFKQNYLAVHIDDELGALLKETVTEPEGFFVDADMNEIMYYGLTPFYSGAYPESPSRCNDAYFMNNFASSQHISEIIDYYGFNKFLVTKYSIYEGYLVTGTLYDYLYNNDKYVILYDNDFCAYFVER